MTTRIYGTSDDLIEFDGDAYGEVGYNAPYGEDPGCLLICSDGTLLRAKYGKPSGGGIWEISLLHKGSLFERISACEEEDDEDDPFPNSDVVRFSDGLRWAYAAKEWEKVH